MKLVNSLYLCLALTVASVSGEIPATEEAFLALSLEQQQEVLKEVMAIQAAERQNHAEIATYQELHNLWSRQVDTITGLLQQLVAYIHQDSIHPKNKEKTLARLGEYIGLVQDFQVRTTTSEKTVLFHAVTISKNIIDHLRVAVAEGFNDFAIPSGEYLTSPAKNAISSGQYIKDVLASNEQKLAILEKDLSKIGLTWTNNALRTTEKFVTSHKRPLLFVGALAAAAVIYQNNEAIGKQIPLIKDALKPNAEDLKFGAVTLLVFREQLARLGNSLIASSLSNGQYYYYSMKSKLAELYMRAKGIQIERKDGFFSKISQVTLDDCVGLEDQKSKLFEIVDYLRNPEPYIRSGNEPEKGMLLVGGSGNGKTMLAKALAAQINQQYGSLGETKKIKFIELNHEDLKTRGIQLTHWIREAMKHAPCIIFIDEIHLYGLKKDGDKELLNQFLTQMHELHAIKDPDKQVFIIGATNHPELLAPELFKHKRFGTVITFKNPSITQRKMFFTSAFEKYGISHPLLEIEALVSQTHECTYSHLQQIVETARFTARSLGQAVRQEHLQGAINVLVHGISSSSDLTEDEARIASADQAGKTLTHILLNIPETIQLVTINKVVNKIQEEQTWWAPKKESDALDIQYGKLITTTPCEEIKNSSPENLEKLCKRLLAGGCAQKLLHGFAHIDYSTLDYQNAVLHAQKIVTRGLPISSLPDQQRTRICQQTEELVQRFEKEIETLLAANKEQLEIVANALFQEKIVTGLRIAQLIK